MRPAQLAKSNSEHSHQTALFAWCAVARWHGFEKANAWAAGDIEMPQYVEGMVEAVPDLRWFHAVHNQGHGDKIRGNMAKAEGVRKGVADTFLPARRNGWPGLYIELKKPGKGKTLSKEQIEFGVYVKEQGYGWIMCEGWESARDVLIQYLTWGEQP